MDNHRNLLDSCASARKTRPAVKLVERTFRLEAPDGLGRKPRPELIGPVLTHLHATLQDAVRMGFLHSSRARGRIPSLLKNAAEVFYTGHSADGSVATLLHFEVAPFGEAAGALFRQQLLWDDGPKAEQTAFELLAASLDDITARRTESNRFDPGLLNRVRSYGRIVKHGLTQIALPDAQVAHAGRIDSASVAAAGELAARIPEMRRVRVVGRLDVMGASQCVLKLELRPGVIVTALWEGAGPVDALKEFFNRDVVVEGAGVFRPSGGLLRIDADAIAPASQQDEFFREVPTAPMAHDFSGSARLRPGEPSAYAAIFGAIPAEESDEEFAAAVEALS